MRFPIRNCYLEWERIKPAREEWQQFIPGSRMYKGKKTLFYNGEQLHDMENFFIYDEEERESWEVIIVLPGVRIIREHMFSQLNLEMVIMNDSVIRIEGFVFSDCEKLDFVRLSRNLEYIGPWTFQGCSLFSLFVPPSCIEIGREALYKCCFLSILNGVSQNTVIGQNAIGHTELLRISPFYSTTTYQDEEEQVLEWVKNVNQGQEYDLHRACSSFNPLEGIIYEIVRREGLGCFKKRNELYMTPLDYLEANPDVEKKIDQRAIMKRYVLEMMGEGIAN